MGHQFVQLKPEQREVDAWGAAAELAGLNRHAWALAVLDAAAGHDDGADKADVRPVPARKRPKAPVNVPPQTVESTVKVSLAVKEDRLRAWQRAADEACMRLRPWAMVMLDIASGLSRIPEQLGMLPVAGKRR